MHKEKVTDVKPRLLIQINLKIMPILCLLTVSDEDLCLAACLSGQCAFGIWSQYYTRNLGTLHCHGKWICSYCLLQECTDL